MTISTYLLTISRRKFRFALIVVVLVFALLLFLPTCGGHDASKNAVKSGQPVVVAQAKSSNVPVYLDALGSVTPTYTVTVRTQINGRLLRVLFQEGQRVKAGDVLAQVDPRPYQAQLTQYLGQLQRDQALLDNANIDLKRYQLLWSQDAVSQQTVATQQALVKQYEGDVQIDKGLIEATRVELDYCNITAPTTGRVGLRLVDPGNFVQTSDAAGIAVVNTIDPITVIFSIAEDDIPQVLQSLNINKKVEVLAYDRQQKQLLATGILLTIDNQIDPTTGTVKLKAQFKNDKNQLFANQFVNIRLLVDTLQQATVVPSAAIRYKSQQRFVYLKNDDHTVSIKPVVLGVSAGDNIAVMDGIDAGDWVVVEGADKLVDGARIRLMSDDVSTADSLTKGQDAI